MTPKAYSMNKNRLLTIFIPAISFVFLLSFDTPSERYFEISKNMEILSSVYAEVNRYYVDEVDPGQLMKTGIDGMLKSLDPYTTYIPEDDIEDFRFISTGQYGGIGSLIGTRNKKVLILMPYEGFPAYKAGLRIGDEIVQIDDHVIQGDGTDEISKLLKGQAGTNVNIKIRRHSEEEILNYTLTREKVTIENVPYYGMVGNDIGYFILSGFTRDAGKNVQNAIMKLKEQGAKKFIFDLRDNTGGLLDEAVKISNLFIPRGKEVVSMRGKVDKWNETFYAQVDPVLKDEQVVILTNGRSASASEIVSGVLQDYDRGILVGRQTFGKGLVQATMNTAYNSKVKVTTAKYYIPSGRCIQAIDYEHRDKEGHANRIPDSLLVKFKTIHGRTVYDGAGLTPDIEVEPAQAPRILRALINKNLIFEYVTEYYYQHDSIGDPRTFKLDDSEFIEFKNWLGDKDCQYELPSEKALEKLISTIAKDSISTISKSDLDLIKEKFSEEKADDLDEAKEAIMGELETEIASRYHFQRGIIESSFNKDPDIQKALELLNDQDMYEGILAQQ